MAEIVLTTLNARYIHASLGLRCLYAGLGELRSRATLLEFTIANTPVEIVEALLAEQPKLIGLGVYIWNIAQTTEVVWLLKRLRPDIKVVLGGPEVSHEVDTQPIVAAADHVVTGEGEVSFAGLAQAILDGRPPPERIIAGIAPDLKTAALPYAHFSDKDVRERVVYVEASRGCPFRCEFCLSSLDKGARPVPLERFLPEMDALLNRGVLQFKFIDRTFNLKVDTGKAILEFFLERYRPGLFLHFEMIPDRLPEALRELIVRFPPGSLQFEIGVQTFADGVSARISRVQNVKRLEENFRFLREHSGVHLHADLIVGLPGETVESFGAGFDRLVALRPHEIQVGLLKRLRGTPIVRHEREWRLTYNPAAPYEILETSTLDFVTLQRLRRFARFWDLLHNSGNFARSLPLIWEGGSPFAAFLALSDALYARLQRTSGISLETLAEQLLHHLVQTGRERSAMGMLIAADYLGSAPRRVPTFLAEFVHEPARTVRAAMATPNRQARHLRAGN